MTHLTNVTDYICNYLMMFLFVSVRKKPVRSSKRTNRTARQQKSNHLSTSTSTTAESVTVESALSDTEDEQKFKSPVVACNVDTSMSVSNDNLSCPKLSSRTTVSLGHRCSNDTVQNVTEHAPSPHAIHGFGLLTVKDKVNVIEGKLDAADPSHAVSSKSPRTPGMAALTGTVCTNYLIGQT